MAVHRLLQVNPDGSQEEYRGKSSSAGAGDAGEFLVLDSTGKADPSIFPNGFGADAVTLNAGEALSAGNFVYISAAGTVLKADATAPAKAARGYVLLAVANGAPATVYFDESNSSLSGLTPGATYFLSATAGGVTANPSTLTTGQICQELGFATSATNLHVNIQEPIIRS